MGHDSIIVSSAVILTRNYADLPFDAVTNAATAGRVVSRTANALQGAGFTLHLLREMSEDNRAALVEARQIPPQLLTAAETAAVLLPVEGAGCVSVGGMEHVCITVRHRGDALLRALEEAFLVEDRLSGGATFAFDEALGYLQADHTRLGTGLTASVMLHLPMLMRERRLMEIIASLKQAGLQARIRGGTSDNLHGDLLEISNGPALGMTEQEICQRVLGEAQRLCEQESEARRKALQENPLKLEDQVARSLGILRCAKLLGQTEFRLMWSEIRLGAALNLLPLSVEQVDALMPQGLDAHLRNYAEEPLDGDALDACRAARVQELLEENPLSSTIY